MADLLIELVSEEIPARMQAGASHDLARLIELALTKLGVWTDVSTVTATCATRHLLAYATDIRVSQPDQIIEKRGPRIDAPLVAVSGFSSSVGVERSALTEEETPKGKFFFARTRIIGNETLPLLTPMIVNMLEKFPWPKSQRWGRGSFRWVRPLRRVNVLFDGKAVDGKIDLGNGGYIEFGTTSCGHYFESPKDIDFNGIVSLDDAKNRLRNAFVMIDATERYDTILAGAQTLASSKSCEVNKAQLGNYLADIAGLVEWPTLLMGQIEKRFMALPPELLQSTIATHQKYITLNDAAGNFSPYFILLSNRLPDASRDKVILEGNQRVLRARLEDAEFFWQQDKALNFEAYLPDLASVTFHDGLGTLHDKTIRMKALASAVTPYVEFADLKAATRAAHLAKIDLVTGLVGEFPELQGVIGGYYAAASGESETVCDAITSHYRPQGPNDDLPPSPTAMVVALVDKIDTLVGFFGIDAKPTGSKDPFALRRAALGMIRIIVDGQLTLPLATLFQSAAKGYGYAKVDDDLLPFIRERLRGYLLDQQVRHDIVAAALADTDGDDICLMATRATALVAFLETPDGDGLMIGWRRVSSILSAEEKKAKADFLPSCDPALFSETENALYASLSAMSENHANIEGHLIALCELRSPIDMFFDKIVVNDEDPKIRRNRLGLLAMIREKMLAVADFTKIEG